MFEASVSSDVEGSGPSGPAESHTAATPGGNGERPRLEVENQTLSERLSSLQGLTAALSAAQSADQVASAALEHGIPALGGRGGVFALSDEDTHELRVAAHLGYPDELARTWFDPFPLSAPLPLAEAARKRELLLVESHEDCAARYPAILGSVRAAGDQAFAAVPLVIEGRLLGTLGISFANAREFSDDDRAFITTYGRQCALALERARLFESDRGTRLMSEQNAERLRIAERRSEFLIKAVTLLSSALDYATTLERITEAAVPDIADACCVYLSEHRNQRLIAIRHVDPPKADVIRELVRNAGAENGHPLAFGTVIRSRKPKLERRTEADAERKDGGDRDWLRELASLDISSWILVPIILQSRAAGAISLMRLGSAPPFSESDVVLAEALAQRSADAIDRARLFEAERRAHADAETANRLKDEFLATISHELRTPLTAILGWATILKSKPDDRKSVERGIAIIERNAQAQARLVDDILDVSRIIGGRLRLKMEEVDVAAIINAALDVVRPAAQAKSLALDLRIEPGLPAVWGDANRLQQVIWNLTSNAVKFTTQGGRVSVEVERGSHSVIIHVSDTGEGISSDFLPYIFERFRQADSSTTRAHGGLGLGLAIVRHLVEMHGGTVSAKSAGRGQGSTFTVELPSRPLRGDAVARPKSAPDEPAPAQSGRLVGLKVLVVDDEADAREMIAQLLESHGAHVITASSAPIAVRALAELRPNVLISDIGMPGTDGYGLIQEVRALGPGQGGDIPAIALTAYARRADAIRALEAGYQMHVTKPIVGAELVRLIAELAQRPV